VRCFRFPFFFRFSRQLVFFRRFSVNERRNDVVQRRVNVKETAAQRRAALAASHTFQVRPFFSHRVVPDSQSAILRVVK